MGNRLRFAVSAARNVSAWAFPLSVASCVDLASRGRYDGFANMVTFALTAALTLLASMLVLSGMDGLGTGRS